MNRKIQICYLCAILPGALLVYIGVVNLTNLNKETFGLTLRNSDCLPLSSRNSTCYVTFVYTVLEKHYVFKWNCTENDFCAQYALNLHLREALCYNKFHPSQVAHGSCQHNYNTGVALIMSSIIWIIVLASSTLLCKCFQNGNVRTILQSQSQGQEEPHIRIELSDGVQDVCVGKRERDGHYFVISQP